MQFKNSKSSWGWMSIFIHWVTAIGVVAMFVLGLWMVELTYYDNWYHKAPHIHKSMGLLLLILTCWRLIWILFNARPEPLKTHTLMEQKLARIAHLLLYVLLVSVMLSGYLISTADGKSLEVFNWFSVPATIYGYSEQADFAGSVHLFLAVTLILSAVLHALAAIKHQVIDKDVTLNRIIGKS